MTNPQFTENLLAVIRSLPTEDRAWLLEQLEQDSDELSGDRQRLMLRRYDIVLVAFPFTDGPATKPRPAMVVATSERQRLAQQ